jgi:pyruvate ferredoxin oxidoreductase gamma subunit
MYRIRFHGRGGQGIKTASQLLGTAFFRAGFQVQDAPRYGAERRGAPIFAFVRAARAVIHERGVITAPDLVIVADASLVAVPAAGVMLGLAPRTVMLMLANETADTWRGRLAVAGPLLVAPVASDLANSPMLGALCAGAAAGLLDVLTREVLDTALAEELEKLGADALARNREVALAAFDTQRVHAGLVAEGAALAVADQPAPDWIDLPLEAARAAAPDIYAPATSELAKTGVWRTHRPIIDYEHCKRCAWICSTLCPDSAIRLDAEADGRLRPRIDYDHCKGCMICVTVCPPHAIRTEPEHAAAERGR